MVTLAPLSPQAQRHISDLYEDLRDGHNLISLLEVLSGENLVCMHTHICTHTHTDIHTQPCLSSLLGPFPNYILCLAWLFLPSPWKQPGLAPPPSSASPGPKFLYHMEGLVWG